MTASDPAHQHSPHRTPYANKGRIILNARDEWMMPVVAEQGGMRYDQLGMWFAFYPEWQEIQEGKPRRIITTEDGQETLAPLVPLTENAVRRIIRRWFQKKFAESDKLQDKKPMWIWMTNAYMQEYGLPFQGHKPQKKLLKHLYDVNEVRLTLARSRRFPRHTWLSERAIIAEREEAMPDVPFEHPPDGALLLPDGSRIAIELQRSIEMEQTFEETMLDLLDNYAAAYYFTTETVEPVLTRARSRLNPDQQEQITIYHVLKEKEQ
jgi:hypothetical protein